MGLLRSLDFVQVRSEVVKNSSIDTVDSWQRVQESRRKWKTVRRGITRRNTVM